MSPNAWSTLGSGRLAKIICLMQLQCNMVKELYTENLESNAQKFSSSMQEFCHACQNIVNNIGLSGRQELNG